MIKFVNIIFLLILLIFVSCKLNGNNQTKKYLLVDDGGILVEKFDSTNFDENKYNHDNIIYKIGNSFKYRFEHVTAGGEMKFFKMQKFTGFWEFVDSEERDSNTIKSVVISVVNGNPMGDFVPDYNQTGLSYAYDDKSFSSESGAIENEGNVWIHPPRDKYFRILEINPFPFIKAPYEIGTKWTWDLTIGDQWADERWKTWEGRIENKYKYEITEVQTIKTVLGEIECFVIESTAESRIGETKLRTYFNAQYGFVKLNYVNIDGSKTNLELIEFEEKKNDR